MGKKTPVRLGCLGWFGIILLVCVGLAYLGNMPGGRSPNEFQAYSDCKAAVKEQLKSPASAKFSNEKFESNQSDDTDFRVSLAVDSQNSFGAIMRDEFSCSLRFNKSSGDWTVTKLSHR